jgi:peptidoglycan hydrolase-like protein with peptidoglycan-binding domain
MTAQKPLSDRTAPIVDDAERSRPRRRPWMGLALVGVIIFAGVLVVMFFLQENSSPTGSAENEPLNFAEVVITDLVQEESFNGTLGSIEDDPVRTQLEGTITEIAERGDTISQGESLFAIDDQPVVLLYGDLPAYRDIAIGEDTVTVSSQLNGTITWVAEQGTVIEQGDVLYRMDDQPVVVLHGEQPAYRTLGIAGPNLDVAVAQASLSSAKANLAALTSPASEQQVQAARQSLKAAQQALQDLLNLPDPAAVQIAQANLTAVQQSDIVSKNMRDREHEAAWFEAFYGEQLKKYEAGQITKDRLDLEWNNLQAAKENLEEARAQAQLALSQAQAEYDQAQQGASPAQIASGQAEVAQAQANLDALEAGPDPDALVAAEAQVEQAQVALDALLSEAPLAGPGYDVLQLKRALAALGYDPDATMAVGDEFTTATQEMVKAWQEEIGAQVDGVVDLGEVVFLPGPAQVLDILASPGSQASSVVSIATGDPATGTDVLQLEEGLVALGFDADGTLVADGIYTPETSQAILAFQAATGLEQDGILDLGEVVFLPGQVRITNQIATKGSWVGAGTALLGVSLSDKVVRVDLPANEQGVLTVGDAVTVEMPDYTLVPATVLFVSQTATPQPNGPTTFEVLVELDDPGVAAGLDEAPVDVIVISDSVQGALAIPVSALVALLEGGYAVELDAGGGRTQLVAVEVGFFGENNMIEITSGALEQGDRVVVP